LTKGYLSSMKDAFRFARGIYKENIGLLTACMLTFFGAWVILEVLVIAGQKLGIIWWLAAHIGFFIVFSGLQIGFIRICLDLYDGNSPSYMNIFSEVKLGAKFLLSQLVYSLMVLVGIALLIIPGAYLGTRYTFHGFLFSEGETDLQKSFQQSANIARSSMGSLFWLVLFLFLFNIVGMSILGIGILVTMPISVLMKAYVYRQLKAG